ncbi:translation initiation factor-like protein eIF-2B subunit beta [Mollisia scopiformis]|uniref:Translation initiation factor eIF2B subunit beta n=1 Tax=Mollisia scopiformis TaxID=149040 RepID=A0A194X683_MOLSC|nr:translation initiation factor-like protein eIF-2B subunit beta [Mollisia scopiformis]KUJ15688.1 translation initiation factor-like protein eIF-2B subunit beta [Mollisia scopiformis]
MTPTQKGYAPNLTVFKKSLKAASVETSIENLISLLKRRQIKNSRPCAMATAELLRIVVARDRWTDLGKLIAHIQDVGRRLVEAQPRELAVGNIVRRVLGMIRDEGNEDRKNEGSDSGSATGSPQLEFSIPAPTTTKRPPSSSLRFASTDGVHFTEDRPTTRPPLMTSHTSYAVANNVPVQQSMFNLLSATGSPNLTPSGANSPHGDSTPHPFALSEKMINSTKDLRAEVVNGIEEILDELEQVDDQIAAYALEHIHSNEVILTHSSSVTVYKFLLKAADKRKFTVIIAESYPNDHEETHLAVMGKMKDPESEEEDKETYLKSLQAAGITVILVTDASIFAIMSRVNKVILATHAVIANGGLVAAAGARIIARAAKAHRTPVIVLSGVYKLSPEHPFEFESLIEYGDPGSIVGYEDGTLVEKMEVDNPLYDYVPPDLVDLYITNLGSHAPSYLYRIVADHYKPEDVNFNNPELLF